MENISELKIDLRQMIIAIETTVSLVGMNDTNHGKRVGYIAAQLGKELGFSDADIQFAFELGLIHDCGVSTEQMHSSLVNHFDWKDAYIHCEIGFQLLKDFEPLSQYAIPIRYHHTPWNELTKLDMTKYQARMANLIFLSDRIDVISVPHYEKDILLVREDIVESISNYEGTYFDPALVHAFLELERSEAFWISLADRHITRYVWDMGHIPSHHILTLSQLKQLSLIMSYIVDQKSPFTARHSVRVADVAKYLAQEYGLSEIQCQKVEIAGLLHDLGKLHIPDDILEKQAPLNDIERAIMNQHSYETFEILRHIQGLDEVARWAAFHHENIDGAGYPFHPTERELSIEARIIAVADIFQALVQDRPYREGMKLDEVLKIIHDLGENKKLDSEVVSLAEKVGRECYLIARGESKHNNCEYIHPIVEREMF